MAKEHAAAVEKEARDHAAQETEAFRTHYPKSLAFDYEFQTRKAPFNVVAIYHDDRFTYIKAAPQEVPALYELKDGKASLVNYSYDAGLYTVQKDSRCRVAGDWEGPNELYERRSQVTGEEGQGRTAWITPSNRYRARRDRRFRRQARHRRTRSASG